MFLPIIEALFTILTFTCLPDVDFNSYNCDESLDIFVHESNASFHDYFKQKIDESALGLAFYGNSNHSEIHVIKNSMYLHDVNKLTIIQHELKHVNCRCNFHK